MAPHLAQVMWKVSMSSLKLASSTLRARLTVVG